MPPCTSPRRQSPAADAFLFSTIPRCRDLPALFHRMNAGRLQLDLLSQPALLRRRLQPVPAHFHGCARCDRQPSARAASVAHVRARAHARVCSTAARICMQCARAGDVEEAVREEQQALEGELMRALRLLDVSINHQVRACCCTSCAFHGCARSSGQPCALTASVAHVRAPVGCLHQPLGLFRCCTSCALRTPRALTAATGLADRLLPCSAWC